MQIHLRTSSEKDDFQSRWQLCKSLWRSKNYEWITVKKLQSQTDDQLKFECEGLVVYLRRKERGVIILT